MNCGVNPFHQNRSEDESMAKVQRSYTCAAPSTLESTSGSNSRGNSRDCHSKGSGNYSFSENSTFCSQDDGGESYNTMSVTLGNDDESSYGSRSYRSRNRGRRVSGRRTERRNDSVDSYDLDSMRSDEWSARDGDSRRSSRRSTNSKYRSSWSRKNSTRTIPEDLSEGRSTFSVESEDSRSYYSSEDSCSSDDSSRDNRRTRKYEDTSVKLLGSYDSEEDTYSHKGNKIDNHKVVKTMTSTEEECQRIQEEMVIEEPQQSELFDPFQVHEEDETPQEYSFGHSFPLTSETIQQQKDAFNSKSLQGHDPISTTSMSVKQQQQESDYYTVLNAPTDTFEDDFSLMLFNDKKMNVGEKVKSKAKSTVKWLKKSIKYSKTSDAKQFNHDENEKDAIAYRRSILNSLQQSRHQQQQQQQQLQYASTTNHSQNVQKESIASFNTNNTVVTRGERSTALSVASFASIKFSDKFQIFKTKSADVDSIVSMTRDIEDSNSIVIYEDYGVANTVMMYFSMVDKPEILHEDEVLVRVQASTVSAADCVIRNNEWYEEIDLPNTPGCDLIGQIEEITESASTRYGLKTGDRVAAFSPKLGGNSRFITLYASQLIPVPEDIDVDSAVCLINAYVTAYQCLHRVGKKSLQYGDKILITDAQNDVGLAICQLAMLQGATIFASAKEEHHDLLRKYGATPIGPDQEAWFPIVQGQIDIFIYNSLYSTGGQLLPYSALSSLGKFIFLGRLDDLIVESDSSTNESHEIPPSTSKRSQQQLPKNVFCYDVFEKAKESPDLFVRDFDLLLYLLKDGTLQPAISNKISLGDIISAHEDYEKELVWGSIVCLPWKGFEKNEILTKTKILDSSLLDDNNGTEVVIDENSSILVGENDKNESFLDDVVSASAFSGVDSTQKSLLESQSGKDDSINIINSMSSHHDQGKGSLLSMTNSTYHTEMTGSKHPCTTVASLMSDTTASRSNAELTTTYSSVEECNEPNDETCGDTEATNDNRGSVILNILSHLTFDEKDRNSIEGQTSSIIDSVVDDGTVDEIEVKLGSDLSYKEKQSTMKLWSMFKKRNHLKRRLPFRLKKKPFWSRKKENSTSNTTSTVMKSACNPEKEHNENSAVVENILNQKQSFDPVGTNAVQLQSSAKSTKSFWSRKKEVSNKKLTINSTPNTTSTVMKSACNPEIEHNENSAVVDNILNQKQRFDLVGTNAVQLQSSAKSTKPSENDNRFLYNWNDWGGQFECMLKSK